MPRSFKPRTAPKPSEADDRPDAQVIPLRPKPRTPPKPAPANASAPPKPSAPAKPSAPEVDDRPNATVRTLPVKPRTPPKAGELEDRPDAEVIQLGPRRQKADEAAAAARLKKQAAKKGADQDESEAAEAAVPQQQKATGTGDAVAHETQPTRPTEDASIGAVQQPPIQNSAGGKRGGLRLVPPPRKGGAPAGAGGSTGRKRRPPPKGDGPANDSDVEGEAAKAPAVPRRKNRKGQGGVADDGTVTFTRDGIKYKIKASPDAHSAYAAIPAQHTVVYTVHDASGEVIYIGITRKTGSRQALDRLKEHLNTKDGEFLGEASEFRIVGHYADPHNAHALEQHLVNTTPSAHYNKDKTPWRTYVDYAGSRRERNWNNRRSGGLDDDLRMNRQAAPQETAVPDYEGYVPQQLESPIRFDVEFD